MRLALVLLLVGTAGCATANREDCQQPYELGFRDAVIGLQRQDDLYQPICTRQGIPLDAARYAQGWREGTYEFEQRRVHGVE